MAARPAMPAAPPPSLRDRKRLVTDVSKKRYLKVMTQLHEGANPNADWKGLLPLRTAVLVGDVDMVALLSTMGADKMLEPQATVKKEDGTEETVSLGKCARELAGEMADDLANPLHVAGKNMARVMDNAEAAKDRVLALQGRLEEQIGADLRSASRNSIIFSVLAVVCGYFLLRQWSQDAGADSREL